MRRALLLLAVLLGASVLPAVARADVVFRGSGDGHGLGMGQYGAYGLANKGWGANRIVTHFYEGTNVAERTPPSPRFRVGLLQYRAVVHLHASSGSFSLDTETGKHVGSVAEGQTRRVRIRNSMYRVTTSGGRLIWKGGGPGNDLIASGGTIKVEEWGHRIRRGTVRFDIVSAERAHVVNVVGAEAYLFGLAEVSDSWPLSALRAQALAGRTYAWRVISVSGNNRSGCSCGVYASTRDQYFIGWDHEQGSGRWVDAVNDTSNEVILYSGAFIQAFYSSSDGGMTDTPGVVWDGTNEPYLKPECDPGDYVGANPNRTWSRSMSAGEVGRRLGVGRLQRFKDWNRGQSGRVDDVTVVGTDATKTMDGWDIRSRLGLHDTRFWVNANRQITGRIRSRYDKEMCRPQLAKNAARDIEHGRWQRFERGRIYVNRRADSTVWIRGPVNDKYVALGAHTSRLKLPRRYGSDGSTTWATFDGGRIECASTCTVTYS